MKYVAALMLVWLLSLSISAQEQATGVITIASNNSVKLTLDKLSAVLQDKGMTIFARVDHSAGAQKVGQALPDTQLLLFGNPRIGTPLMQCKISIAIDLPQKMLAWQDSQGQVWLSYNDPIYLAQRHDITSQNPCYPVMEKVSKALANFARMATSTD